MTSLIDAIRASVRQTVAAALMAVAGVPAIVGAQRLSPSATGSRLGPDPIPTPAIATILGLFESYDVVALPESHGIKDLDDFLLSLVRNPELPRRINDIVIECGNSLYQGVLDRYVAGDSVALSDVRRVWRNTTQAACGVTGFFAQLVPLIRRINQRLAPERRIRVLAADPPVDWDKPNDPQVRFANRDANIAAVMQREVLAKKRKALMLFGTFHVLHTAAAAHPTAVSAYEASYPGRTFVIAPYIGLGHGTPLERGGHELEQRLRDWPVPSVARLKGTWLGDLAFAYFFAPPMPPGASCDVIQSMPAPMRTPVAQVVDGILYVGPRDLLLADTPPAEVILDSAYLAELQRREAGSPQPALNPQRMLERSADVFAYPPSGISKGPVCPPG